MLVKHSKIPDGGEGPLAKCFYMLAVPGSLSTRYFGMESDMETLWQGCSSVSLWNGADAVSNSHSISYANTYIFNAWIWLLATILEQRNPNLSKMPQWSYSLKATDCDRLIHLSYKRHVSAFSSSSPYHGCKGSHIRHELFGTQHSVWYALLNQVITTQYNLIRGYIVSWAEHKYRLCWSS